MAQYDVYDMVDRNYISFNTLTRPPTFSQYNWRQIPSPIDTEFIKNKDKQYELGVKRFQSRDQNIRTNWIDYPVFNSNMNPLHTNYMCNGYCSYKSK